MKEVEVSTVISYCTNDRIFIDACIENSLPFSKEIVVSYGSHFFDGEPENEELIKDSAERWEAVTFAQYPFLGLGGKKPTAGHWHNHARAKGFQALKKPAEWILFLDSDEIVDTDKFIQWLSEFDLSQAKAYRFISHWYFREACWQANEKEEASVLAHSSILSFDYLDYCPGERLGLLKFGAMRGARGLNRSIMFHHYSWARNKEGMLRKVKVWGHMGERNWKDQIEQEFSREFNESCRDFVHGYTYTKVEPFIHVATT